ncbi:MAG: SPFH domain-containing protein [Planctomycetota bacterium]|nr:SPFH domain-containing protein [Planctomycetota bacterium]
MNVSKLLSLGIIGLAVSAVAFRMCVVKIKPGQTGVLTMEWGSGLQTEDFSPGYYLALGPLHTWNIMDTTVQTLNMLRSNPNKRSNQRGPSINPPLKVKSSDGADVTLDITVKYRVIPGEAWKVFKGQGGSDGYKLRVASRTKNTLISGLGKLATEAFFNPANRKSTQDFMETQLRTELKKIDVDLISILIRDLDFQASFSAKIKAKTLTKQKAELEVARTKAAEKTGETKEIVAQTGAKVAVIGESLKKTLTEMRAANDKNIRKVVADYEKYVVETQSEADLYAQQKEALGIKLLKDAEARGEALKRQALTGSGGNTLVALEVAQNLKLGDMMVSTQLVNPLDLNEMMRTLGAGDQVAKPGK